MIRRFVSGLFLALSVFTMVSGVAQAQLKEGLLGDENKPFSASSIFQNVYKTDANLQQSLPAAIGSVISMVLAFTGLVLLIIMVYSGILWLTAGGNEDQVADAKARIKNAVIGMAIALSAFVITNFVVSALTSALNQTGTSGSGGGQTVTGGN
jgi:hypothetical protein